MMNLIIHPFLCFFALSLSVGLIADDCDIPDGTYTADWTDHADADSAQVLKSACTRLVISRSTGNGPAFFDWFLTLESNDGKKETYELSRLGSVSCLLRMLDLKPYRDNSRSAVPLFSHLYRQYKPGYLRTEDKELSFLPLQYHPKRKELTSYFSLPYFDIYHRANGQHIYLRQLPEKPFKLTKQN